MYENAAAYIIVNVHQSDNSTSRLPNLYLFGSQASGLFCLWDEHPNLDP